ncbi:hypothetical protein ID858_07935 [Xenorhabdus sp. DI]|uniref:hypothetical protein n=1 Tax=Xenorhabdus doucetiae TaxID=351671 RepID=UPI00198E9ED9|nr:MULTISPECIES: hypothetical protein [unclassified Xenorhabdus]MBD2785413.1 hypothetical protein [Xenorhabdus sp. 3]MBD2788437.1 hypothetical protein [Xenorhabdus sp. DI]
MEIWFKQFESHGKQVLVKKALSSDEDKVGVQFCWPEKDFHVEVGPWLSFNDDNYDKIVSIRDEFFDKTTQEVVDEMVEEVLKTIGEPL